MKIKPTKQNVLVKVLEVQATPAGIIMPGRQIRQLQRVEVLAIGPDVDDSLGLKEGSVVLIEGHHFAYRFDLGKDKAILMNSDELLGVEE